MEGSGKIWTVVTDVEEELRQYYHSTWLRYFSDCQYIWLDEKEFFQKYVGKVEVSNIF